MRQISHVTSLTPAREQPNRTDPSMRAWCGFPGACSNPAYRSLRERRGTPIRRAQRYGRPLGSDSLVNRLIVDVRLIARASFIDGRCFGGSQPLPLARAVICLDPVSVPIDDKGGIVIGVVHRPQTGCAIVTPACAQRRGVKRIDRGGIRRRKAEMQTRLFVRRNRALGDNNPVGDNNPE
jgi:hypothetical protein